MLALIVGTALGGGLGLYFASVASDVLRESLASSGRTVTELLEQNRELAHKVSAPEQASVDHLFEKERIRRSQEREARKRQEVAAAIDRELEARGVEIE